MEIVTTNESENEKFVGYNCIYRYGGTEIQLSCDILTGIWTLVPDNDYSEEEQRKLNRVLSFVNEYIRIDAGYTLDEQIKSILKDFDRFFYGEYKTYLLIGQEFVL